jgi:nucleoside-diphosphate kinase
VVALVWEGEGAVAVVRATMGATDPAAAAPGTIRGDLGLTMPNNVVHGSDSVERAAVEVGLFFRAEELVAWESALRPWVEGG